MRNRFTHLDEPASPNVRSSGGDDVYDSDAQQGVGVFEGKKY